ncbi:MULTISPECIES: aspartate ammonia-lyase [Gluconobacter]|uniref:aspartate ammonia-lyase n=1 Tax=Gluconobacter TaxID=441 RepID=UPI0039E91DDE
MDNALNDGLKRPVYEDDTDSHEMFRVEKDLLGSRKIPQNARWGVHTARAQDNFPISGISVGASPFLVKGMVLVKQAAARTNLRLGTLEEWRAEAIDRACQDILDNRTLHEEFVVDVMQGGAGTSTNMNTNEVIANVALELLGKTRGDYNILHPNDHVNMMQSTNDSYPTGLHVALLLSLEPLLETLNRLANSLRAKSAEFGDVLKLGRTQLRDAVPMTLGQEFRAFSTTILSEIANLENVSGQLLSINLGGTAIGTGITAHPGFGTGATQELRRLTGYAFKSAPDLVEATSDVGAFVSLSGALKRLALKLSKIAGDFRLLSSGPWAGLGEISLPAVQAGSSIMPGKVNPVIPEAVNQVAYLVCGHDLTVTMCAEGSQLQLNPFEPMIAHCLLSSMQCLSNAVTILTTRCVDGIEADRERCRSYVEGSASIITALVPRLGYEVCSRLAKRASGEKRKILDLLMEEDLLPAGELAELLRLERLTGAVCKVLGGEPSVIGHGDGSR